MAGYGVSVSDRDTWLYELLLAITENPKMAESDADGLYRSRMAQTDCADIGKLERAYFVREQHRPTTPRGFVMDLAILCPQLASR
jgi:hypothetical protein